MKEKEKELAYVSGFLGCLMSLNSFADDAKSYEVIFLPKKEKDISVIIHEHFEEDKWTITSELIQENWKTIFEKELVPYFAGFSDEISRYTVSANDKLNNIQTGFKQEMEIRKQAHDRYLENINDAIKWFNRSIEKLLTQNFAFYKINVDTNNAGWYEAYADDYAFDLEDQILFIHFGGSD